MNKKIRVISVGNGKLDLTENMHHDNNLEVIFDCEFYTKDQAIKKFNKIRNGNITEYLISVDCWEQIQDIKTQQEDKEIYLDSDTTIYAQGYNNGKVDIESLRRKYGV